MPASPAASSAASTVFAWKGEVVAGLAAAVAGFPLVPTLGLVAFGAIAEHGARLGMTAAATSSVVGGIVMALAGRSALPVAGPTSPTTLILAALVVRVAVDPAIDPATTAGVALLLAATGAAVFGAGALMALLGLARLGALARFVPQPVLAGFMNGVAVLIVLAQLPALLGIDGALWHAQRWHALAHPHLPSLALGLAVAWVAWQVPKKTSRVPGALVGLAAGLVLGEAIAWLAPTVSVARVGPLDLGLPAPIFAAAMPAALAPHAAAIALTALLIALIGSLESVLSLAALDQLLNRRSEPNRELIALGVANAACGALGGLPVVYARLRASATAAAGGRSRRAVLVSGFVLAALLVALQPWLARLPLPALAGVVIALALLLVDRWTRQLAQQWWRGDRTLALNLSLGTVAVVCVVTIAWGFVAGVGVGVVLAAAVVFGSVSQSLFRRRYSAAEVPSRRVYAPPIEDLLAPQRARIEVVELEGALFFGNADRLAHATDALDAAVAHLVVDLRRVTTIDASGAVTLLQAAERLARRHVRLRLAGVAPDDRHGAALRAHGAGRLLDVHCFADADRAIEDAERELLRAAGCDLDRVAVALDDCALLAGLPAAARAAVTSRMRCRRLARGEVLFYAGEPGAALYVLTAGSVSIAATADASAQRFVSFSPGMIFGETAVLDGRGRTAAAIADAPSEVHELPGDALAELQRNDPQTSAQLYRNLAMHLSVRLRSSALAWRHADE